MTTTIDNGSIEINAIENNVLSVKSALTDKRVVVTENDLLRTLVSKVNDLVVSEDGPEFNAGVIPKLTGPVDREQLLKHLEYLQLEKNNIQFGIQEIVNEWPNMSGMCIGGIYSPEQKKIYQVPYMGVNNQWRHYIDCVRNIGKVVTEDEYAWDLPGYSGTMFNGGGAYCPTNNKIYFIPNTILPPGYEGEGNDRYFSYFDCIKNEFVRYTPVFEGVFPENYNPLGYIHGGGVYSPTQNRIYLTSSYSNVDDPWFYIDCETDKIVIFYPNITLGDYLWSEIEEDNIFGYRGGVYSPTQNRIYLVPPGIFHNAVTGPNTVLHRNKWHYIDCETGDVVAYDNGLDERFGLYYLNNPEHKWMHNGFSGGVYSPIQDRIYFIPSILSNGTDNGNAGYSIVYIDCKTGKLRKVFTSLSTVTFLGGGVYSPVSNRIYLVPYVVSNDHVDGRSTWYYIDCDTDELVGYPGAINTVENKTPTYMGGVYSPEQNAIYFMPLEALSCPVWHCIKEYSTRKCSPQLAAHAMFNKF